MRRSLKRPAVVAALLLAVACASLQPGADPVVVRAEQAWQGGFASINAFLKVEDAARRAGDIGVLSFLQTPAVHEFAEKLRRKINPANGQAIPERFGKYVFDRLDSAIQVYKANRTAEGKAELQTWLALALELVQTAQRFMGGQDPVAEFWRLEILILEAEGYQDAGASRERRAA